MKFISGKVWFALFLVLVMVLVISKPVFWDGCLVVSSGQRVGELQRISTKGLIIRTTEGELALYGSGGSQKGKVGQSSTDFANTWSFSVDTNEVAAKIDSMIKVGQTHVRVEYVEYFFGGRYGSNYRVRAVDTIKKEQ